MWVKWHMSKFMSEHLACDPTLLHAKNSPNSTKSNCIFPGKKSREELTATVYFFQNSAIFMGKWSSKIGGKVKTLGQSLFHKNSNPSKNFQAMLLFARELPLVRILAKLYHIWWRKNPKNSRKRLFHEC